MEQRFDFDENDTLLTRMRQRFDTYHVPVWRRPAFWGGVLIVVAALFAVILLVSGLNKGDEGDVVATADELPLIGADGQPVRQAPQAEMGEPLTGTENNLFDSMTANDTGVLQEEAAPLAPKTDPLAGMEGQDGVTVKNGVRVIAENKVGPVDTTTPAPVTATTAPSAAELTAPASIPTAPADKTLMNEVFEETAAPVMPAPAAPAEVAKAPEVAALVPAPAPAATTADSRYVQLASIREEAEAAKHWESLKAKHGATISALQYRVVKADIPGKGIYYRIQAGPVGTTQAQDICGTLNAATPGTCLVVKP